MCVRIGALVLFALLPSSVSAQSITTVPATAVPVAGPWLLIALWLVLLVGATWVLRHRRQQAGALVVVLLLATGLWMARAQGSLQFSNPEGETVTLPVTQILSGGDVQGFERPVFTNATAVSLQISAIDEPDFADCFPTGLGNGLPPLDEFNGTACTVGLVLGSGESCTARVDAMCFDRTVGLQATISVTPASLTFDVFSSATLTVTNDASSLVPAHATTAEIPAGSGFTILGNTCAAPLPPGASCTISFLNPAEEQGTVVPISGFNTNTVEATLSTVAAPTITISGPVQQERVVTVAGVPLSLVITNDASSATNATGVTVVDKFDVPDVVVDASDCASIAPGASCTLALSSPTPYAPATLYIGGTNTANLSSTLVAFSHLGGLVFEESGGSGKIVIDATQEFTSQWAGANGAIAGATSDTDGAGNTDALVGDVLCSGDANNCAAQQCRDILSDWYLPAPAELAQAADALCGNDAIPCNFGGFVPGLYWTSKQVTTFGAAAIGFPLATGLTIAQTDPARVRCVRTFSP